MNGQKPAYWAFGVRGALEKVVRANFPSDLRQWPLLREFDANAYRVGERYFVLVMRDKLSGIPVIPAEMNPLPFADHPQLPVTQSNLDVWLSFLYSAFSLRLEDIALILPAHDAGKTDASADYGLFSGTERALWERQLAFAVERQHRIFQAKQAPAQVTYNVSGPNARLNINSTDNSVNVVNAAPTELFEGLLEVIRDSKADADAVGRLSAAVEALKQAHGTKTFGARYRDFMAVLADHIQVFGPVVAPYLPTLAALVSG